MEDCRKNLEIFGIEVHITNIVKFNVKSNRSRFAQKWVRQQLASLIKRLPEGAQLSVQVVDIKEDNEDYAVEVYEDGDEIKVIKNELFGGKDANS
jgi:hypothetical protein